MAFTFLFSSPLAVQFLTLFNYFTLSSLYVLLNIRIPYPIFKYLSLLLKACQSDIFVQFGLSFSFPVLSKERVTDERALYFGIGSDILSNNNSFFIILLGNVLLYELIVFITNTKDSLRKAHKTLTFLRGEVYFGLLVSNMVPLILPYKYTFIGGI
jgi:hypothetical protein